MAADDGRPRPIQLNRGELFEVDADPGTALPIGGRRGLIPTTGSEFSTLGLAGAGFVHGLTKVPIVGKAFEDVVTQFPGVSEELLAELARQTGESNLAKGFAFLGEFGPQLLGGAAAFTGGRAAAVKGLQMAAPGAARALGSGRLAGQFAKVASKAGDFAGIPGGAPPVATLQRAAEIFGGGLGLGSLSGLEAAFEGKSVPDIAKATAITAALTMGFEGGITVAAKTLPFLRTAREVDQRKVLSRFLGNKEVQDVLEERGVDLTKKLATRQASLEKLLGVDRQARELDKIRKARTGIKALETEISANKNFVAMNPLLGNYIREKPIAEASTIQEFLLATFKTPEQMARELGVNASRFIRLAQQAEMEVSVGRNLVNKSMVAWKRKMAQSMGLRGRGPKDGKFTEPVFEAYQLGGIEAAANLPSVKNPALMRQALGEVDDALRQMNGDLLKIGARLSVSPGELGKRGLRHFFPGVVDRSGPEEVVLRNLRASFMKAGFGRKKAEKLASQIALGKKRNILFFGDDIVQANMKGTTGNMIREFGAPLVDDPLVSLLTYFNAGQRRLSYGKRFGVHGELVDKTIVPAVEAEGASVHLFRSMADAVLGRNYGTEAQRAAAATITNAQIAAKLPLAVFPNMSQSANTGLFLGYRNLARGLKVLNKNSKERQILEGMAINDSIVKAWRESFLDTNRRSSLGDVADWVLWRSGFTFTERWNRMFAGATGMTTVSRDLVKATGGKLRGRNLDTARRRWKQMGLDLDEQVRLAKGRGGTAAEQATAQLQANGDEVLRQAAFGSIRTTQFLPDRTRRPTLWNTPVGRVVFQFKTFALNQSRFLRDTVVAEAARGNMKPLATFLAFYPIAGEAVSLPRSLFNRDLGRPEETGIDRYLSNVSAVGGFGLAGDIWTSATFGKLPEFVLGPSVGDAFGFTEAMANADLPTLGRHVARQPAYKFASTVLLGAAGGLLLGLEAIFDDDSENDVAVPLEQLGRR